MRPLSTLTIFGIRLATIVLVVYWIALFTGTHMPSPPSVKVPHGDKLLHFTAFFGLGLLLCWAIPTRRQLLRKLLIVLTLALSYAALDEWSQRFAPRRTVDLDDFYANAAGVLSAVTLYVTVRALWLRGRQKRRWG